MQGVTGVAEATQVPEDNPLEEVPASSLGEKTDSKETKPPNSALIHLSGDIQAGYAIDLVVGSGDVRQTIHA